MASPHPALPPVHVPLPRLLRAVAAVSAPAVLAVLGVGWSVNLAPEILIAVPVSVVAVIAGLVYHHLANLERLRLQVEHLARESSDAQGPLPATPAATAGLAEAVAELDHRWARRGSELQALVAANEGILEAIPDPLILVDAAHRVTRANAAARALFGDAVAGRDLDTVLRHPEVLEAAEEHLAGRTSAGNVELPWAGPPERHFSVRFARLPLPESDPGHDAQGAILLVLHDVTALKRAERMRADFVANVSHELRTPLSALLGFTETLRGPARDDAAARDRFLGIMHDQAQRMTRLVRDLLSLSRIEQSEHTPPTERIELGRIIGSVLDTLALQAKARSVTIEVDLAPKLPSIAGDGDQLAQVFQNLLDNAIKYGRANGKVRVVARVAPTAPRRIVARAPGRAYNAPPGGWVAVAVADDGEGIPREHLSRLTERFYRVDAARSRQLGGTGLGLAIVKHILNRHRGGLIIDSEPGKGAVFTVWLPVAGESLAGAAAD
jgi:two-component system phosphate regulon sensor histidine kinase PhoR